MPDGTDVGGTPSNLFATMNTKWPTATWQKEILRGLQSYAANSKLNFSVVSDDGSPFGSAGLTGTDNNVQGDHNFGDIRIGGFNLSTNLGIGLLPPPKNGDTTAGDYFLNTAFTWNIGSTYDLYTVATHEAGHALGLDHSTTSTAVMYASYNAVKSALTSDDISGINGVYGARPADKFDAVKSNSSTSAATVLTADSNKQINQTTGLDITTTSDVDWYKITVPSGAASSMSVRMQSQGLSLLAPKLELYNSSGKLISGKSVTGTYGSTVQLTQTISASQVYYIKAMGADTTAFGTGSYALQVNMGTAALPTVTSPNTATAATGGGGVSSYQCPLNNPGLCMLLYKINELLAEGYSTAPEGNESGLVVSVASPASEGESDSGGAFARQPSAEHARDSDHRGTDEHDLRRAVFVTVYARADNGAWDGEDHSHRRQDRAMDHIFEFDPFDVRRPGFALVSELATDS